MILVCSLFFSAFYNGPFWTSAVPSPLVQWKFALSLLLITTALHCLILAFVVNRWTAKPLLTILLVVTALAAHYMNSYGVYLDADMLRNILHTDAKESGELITARLLIPLGLALIPISLLWWVQQRKVPFVRALLVRLLFMASMIVLIVIGALLSSRDVSTLLRSHREVRYLATPANYIVSLYNVLLASPPGKKAPLIVIGKDARQVVASPDRKPRLVVLVVGETVRAQNWGLNGYPRMTTPRLSKVPGLINFRDVTACGSSTEVSLPCMFSPYGRENYNADRIRTHQSLLHVLEHAGVGTMWLDNQSGCKGVCDGLPIQNLSNGKDPGLCNGKRCFDEILVKSLQSQLAPTEGDRLVVLHQLGNHGPSYFERYPPAFKQFNPTCENPELGQCSVNSIVNAYDNAVLYTDHVLAETIALLAKQSEYDTAMIYVSDHGESLGEKGLFLHGIPYSIAPKEQLHVPMVMWLSPGMIADTGLDPACLEKAARRPASHDNLFSSVLDLFDVWTALYSKGQDLFGSCRMAH